MSQVLRAANLVRELEPEHFRVLQAIELGMRRFKYVPMEQISFYARYNRDETQYRLDQLHKKGLLQRNSQVGYIGYQLISESYDILALHTLAKKEIISSVGKALARGKESDVFFAQTPDGEKVAMKIHRVGQTSFRQVRKLRGYVKKRKHISWLYVSRLSAEREYKALEKIKDLNLGTPIPYGQNRHIVVMSLISGRVLSTVEDLEDPESILEEVLEQVEILYKKGNIIHCDLSEYNILLSLDNQRVIIIDYPQWVNSDHPNAHSYLERDLINVQNYFFKNFQISFNIDEFMKGMGFEDTGSQLS